MASAWASQTWSSSRTGPRAFLFEGDQELSSALYASNSAGPGHQQKVRVVPRSSDAQQCSERLIVECSVCQLGATQGLLFAMFRVETYLRVCLEFNTLNSFLPPQDVSCGLERSSQHPWDNLPASSQLGWMGEAKWHWARKGT